MKKVILGLLFTSLFLGACGNKPNSDSSSSSSTQQEITEKSSETKATSSKVETTSDFVATASEATFDGTMLKGNSYSIKITDYKVIQPGEAGNDYGEKPVIAFWFDTLVNPDYDNSAPISPNTAWILNFKAIQDNDPNKVNKLTIASLPDDKYLQDQSAEIKPGGSISSAVAYELTDTETPVTLTAESMMGDNFGSADLPVK
ncbi:DUF5067 domain-containing protein [Enterococcus thailandicus]|uniref:DUF5067 domain-containing protein n=1 Tax=Enterococcus thailandicus TaxID=417368 RepID=UPI0022EBCEFC|nr:DUF5067 domain-containing protein [Enterococcus thailandicus]MDA3974504.1 DUF5067 domain-containing protein [Enterococcus thailandicus]MDA3976991.1 DUF5067 domain-containing protein [Enterococcus thailandicus]MDA3981957.1 DUF5067 domain-containing protein [Enterococcus thailandicus]